MSTHLDKIGKNIKEDQKALLFIFISFVSLASLFMPTKNFLFFQIRLLAPSPIVFSKKLNHESSYGNYTFEFFSNQNKTSIKKIFNRDYYKNLSGPHRYKMFHFIALNKNSLLEPSRNSSFYKNIFCDYDDVKKAFKIDFQVSKVIIQSNQRVLHEVHCIE